MLHWLRRLVQRTRVHALWQVLFITRFNYNYNSFFHFFFPVMQFLYDPKNWISLFKELTEPNTMINLNEWTSRGGFQFLLKVDEFFPCMQSFYATLPFYHSTNLLIISFPGHLNKFLAPNQSRKTSDHWSVIIKLNFFFNVQETSCNNRERCCMRSVLRWEMRREMISSEMWRIQVIWYGVEYFGVDF